MKTLTIQCEFTSDPILKQRIDLPTNTTLETFRFTDAVCEAVSPIITDLMQKYNVCGEIVIHVGGTVE